MDAITSFVKNTRKNGSKALHKFDTMAKERAEREKVLAPQKEAERLKAEFAKKYPGVKFNFTVAPTQPPPQNSKQPVKPKKHLFGVINYTLKDKSIVKITALLPGGLIYDAKDLPLKTGGYTLQSGDEITVENGKIKTVKPFEQKQFSATPKPTISKEKFAKIEAATKELISAADDKAIDNLKLRNDEKGIFKSFITGLKKLIK